MKYIRPFIGLFTTQKQTQDLRLRTLKIRDIKGLFREIVTVRYNFQPLHTNFVKGYVSTKHTIE